MLYKLAEGRTDWWKRFWVLERAVAEAILYKPGKWISYVAAGCILFILLMNWFVVGQRLTKWQGFLSGAAYEMTGFLMGITSVIGIAVTWYAGAHIRIHVSQGEVRSPKASWPGCTRRPHVPRLDDRHGVRNVGGGPGRRLSGEVLDGVVHT